ncbi:serine/threonine-protein kinase [Rubrivirga litoralis]|uniref:Serine/threonine-protein kinase n=1 Tax=Rubrivirga litoralis TaxID=3075598 RepID=A0ABU3BQA7_9BACT|nr:serine/threonine-protein kinase [Rubrivirga sp. F394]MDT0631465.1 serine/threonine-protein kinase [Rubrivirga sp. F394]
MLLDLLLDAETSERSRVVALVREHAPEYAGRAEALALAVGAAPEAGFLARPAAETFAAHLADPDLAPGDVVGAYRVVREIGRGGMGVVYLAERPDVGLRAALKVLAGPVADDDALDPDLERFREERRHLAGLVHPGVTQLYDAGHTDDGRPYFVMELVEGEPITGYADRRRLGPRDRAELFVQLCEAVRHVHGRGVVHGDVKPDNVLVADDDEGRPVAKLLDFGVAARWRGISRRGTEAPPLPYRPFTYAYTAPELVAGGAPTPASDVYALGVVLRDLVAGGPAAPRGLRLWLKALAQRAASPDVGRRPATAVDLLAEVRAALRVESQHSSAPLSSPTLFALVAASALAAAVVARAVGRS